MTVAYRATLGLLCAFVALACWVTAGADAVSRSAVTSDAEFAGVTLARRLAWFDRRGQVTLLAAPPRGYAYPRLSPDGRRVVLDIRDEGHGLWTWDEREQRLAPLSVGRASDIAPLWTHDGSRLLFARGRGVAPGLFTLTTEDARQLPQRLAVESNSLLMPSSLTPDDRQLLVTASVASGFHVYAVDWQASGRVTPLIVTAADDLNAEISPDGRWIAFQSRAAGQFDIWVAPAPSPWAGPAADRPDDRISGGGKVRRVTPGGGTRPVWVKNGRELLYLTTEGDVMVMAVETSAADEAGDDGVPWPRFGTPTRLFRAAIYQELVGRTFDVTPGGDRILAIVEGFQK